MIDHMERTLALFYCQNVPGSSEKDRQDLELKYGKSLRLFPIPCSGRLEPLHLLRALEDYADAAYVVTCPEGFCRYFEGNRRALKRVERTKAILRSIGLGEDQVGLVMGIKGEPKSLSVHADELMDRIGRMPPSAIPHT
jgi:coenzyme F420-reducing hydrogenase delta subunit